jgi:hypothetical protein
MDANRHNANPYVKYKLYFNLLQRKIAKYKVDAEHIYNIDEKGFISGVARANPQPLQKAILIEESFRSSVFFFFSGSF